LFLVLRYKSVPDEQFSIHFVHKLIRTSQLPLSRNFTIEDNREPDTVRRMALVVYTGINNYPSIPKSSGSNKVSYDDAPSCYVGLSNQGGHCPMMMMMMMIILTAAYSTAQLLTARLNSHDTNCVLI
jgi:hypothetical protein